MIDKAGVLEGTSLGSLAEIEIPSELPDNFCYDGLPIPVITGRCGNGACNAFGCNCDGGCRTNLKDSDDEAERLHRVFYISQNGFETIADSNEILRT